MHKPDLSFWKIWNLSFGFFGVQIAYSLQSAGVSRIFATLGADPHSLNYFWVLPPLMGILVQPLVGYASDRTWTRLGRRVPYLLVGALFAIVVMCMLPNAGSMQLSAAAAMMFGAAMLMLLDTSINMAMQPFKMLVGDCVNERQKGFAYSIQSFLCNTGSLAGFLMPFVLAYLGISNVAAAGVVPNSVIYSFYAGAVILILCVLYTCFKVKEMPPAEYARFHGIVNAPKNEPSGAMTLLRHAPREFWSVGLIQFFCWSAFMYMWTYTGGAIAQNVWHTADTSSAAYQEAGNWVGVLFAVQAVGAALWALVIPRIKPHKAAYVVSMALGAVGFLTAMFIHNQYLLFISYLLIGCAWAAALALPFTLLTNALSGRNIGAYLGLFNGTICIPQIAAALAGSALLRVLGSIVPRMLGASGVLLLLGCAAALLVLKPKQPCRS